MSTYGRKKTYMLEDSRKELEFHQEESTSNYLHRKAACSNTHQGSHTCTNQYARTSVRAHAHKHIRTCARSQTQQASSHACKQREFSHVKIESYFCKEFCDFNFYKDLDLDLNWFAKLTQHQDLIIKIQNSIFNIQESRFNKDM